VKRSRVSMLRRVHSRLSRFRGGTNYRECRRDGLSLLLNLNDSVGRQIYIGDFEREEVRFLSANVRPEDVCFDVGANVGYFAAMMGRLARKVYAFEPVPLNYHVLSANIILSGLQNIETFQVAASDKDGTAKFTISTDTAYSSLLDTGRNPIGSSVAVDTVTLDSFCVQHSIPRIDCLKIDVEGAEPKVIAGASKILSDPKRRPRFIVAELYNPMLQVYGSSIPAMVETLAGFGYKPFIDLRGAIVPFTAQHYDTHYNVFFTAPVADTSPSLK
jgi:FkbM family methyltransferase